MAWIVLISTMLVLCAGVAQALADDNAPTAPKIYFRQDSKGEVVELSGLSTGCAANKPAPVPLVGKVVKRQFADDAMRITGFVIEFPDDGTRAFVNPAAKTGAF